jgi:heterodisulfide reductase subunit A
MVNIRNHDSWVHKDFPEQATAKAMDLVRMAVARVALQTPLTEQNLDINQSALVVGGGISGMAAARALSAQGYPVHLVEKADGWEETPTACTARPWAKDIPSERPAGPGG